MFEVYIYFDPTVPSNYNILSQEYQYLPIYVGKGNINKNGNINTIKTKTRDWEEKLISYLKPV